jgi:hypothetical protein
MVDKQKLLFSPIFAPPPQSLIQKYASAPLSLILSLSLSLSFSLSFLFFLSPFFSLSFWLVSVHQNVMNQMTE